MNCGLDLGALPPLVPTGNCDAHGCRTEVKSSLPPNAQSWQQNSSGSFSVQLGLTSRRSISRHPCSGATGCSKGEFLYHHSPKSCDQTAMAHANAAQAHTHRSNRGHEHFARCDHTSHHSLPVACGAAVRKTFGGKVPTTRMTLNFGACNMQTTCMFRQNRLLWPVKVRVSAQKKYFQKAKNACWPPSASSHSAIANTSFEPQRKPPSMPNSCCQSLGCKRYESYTNITGHIF